MVGLINAFKVVLLVFAILLVSVMIIATVETIIENVVARKTRNKLIETYNKQDKELWRAVNELAAMIDEPAKKAAKSSKRTSKKKIEEVKED